MKSGTTTLHNLLSKHKDIEVCPRELFFFDIDEFKQHPEYFSHANNWCTPDYGSYLEKYGSWYERWFTSDSAQFVGERTSTYLASSRAAERIYEQNPQMKFIFILRDPVERAYSQYWHMLRRGQITRSFELEIRYGHRSIIDRSNYYRQIERYRNVFGEDQIHILLFEKFIKSPGKCLNDILAFIGAEITETSVALPEENTGSYPVSQFGQYITNWLLYFAVLEGTSIGARKLPHLESQSIGYSQHVVYYIRRLLTKLNCSLDSRPDMEQSTKEFLQSYFYRKNSGLRSLVRANLSRYWVNWPSDR